MVLEKLDIHSQKNKDEALTSSVGNDQFSEDQIHRCET